MCSWNHGIIILDEMCWNELCNKLSKIKNYCWCIFNSALKKPGSSTSDASANVYPSIFISLFAVCIYEQYSFDVDRT